MKHSDLSQTADKIVSVAMQSARDYLKINHLKADDNALFECVKAWCKIKLPEALHDAKEAYDCGMNQWGQQTFFASFQLAGIEAAKEAGFPIDL